MLKPTTLDGMRTILKEAYSTPAKDIALRLMEELEELIVVLEDIKGTKRCFCSMPVHSQGCVEGMKWLNHMSVDLP